MEQLKHLLFVFTLWIAKTQSQQNILMEPADPHQLLKSDQAFKLTCSTKYTSDLKLEWVVPPGVGQDSYEIKSDFTYHGPNQVRIEEKNVELIIPKYSEQMAGTYKCQLTNTTTNPSKLENEYAVDFHTVTIEGEEDVMFHPDNKTLTLTCKIAVKDASIGKPVWKIGDTLISDVLTEGSVFEANGENLTIKGVMRSDADLYTAEYSLDIKGDNVIYKCRVPLKAGPLVLKFEKSKNLIQEDNLELQCKVLGYPKPVVMWYKDSELIVDSGSGRITKKDLNGVKNATLEIKNVDYDDAGDYKCLAVTEELKSNSSQMITVRVKDKFAALWPFLGIVGEVIVLCTIIFIYEKRRSRLAEQEEAAQEEPDGAATDRSEGLRHRNTTANNPRA